MKARRLAAELLAKIASGDARHHAQLLELLDDQDSRVRSSLATALGMGGYKGTEPVSILLDVLEHGPGLNAREALRGIGKAAIPAMLDMAIRLSKLSAKEQEQCPLMQLLWDVGAIGCDDVAMIPKLVEIVGDGRDPYSQRVPRSIRLIGRFGAKARDAVPTIVTAMKRSVRPRHEGIYESAVKALILIGTPEATEALREVDGKVQRLPGFGHVLRWTMRELGLTKLPGE